MTPRHRDKSGEIGHVAVHAVMPLDDEQRMAVARPRLGEHLVGGFRVEMTKRHAPCARQDCALYDAVMDERVVDDQIVAAEQMADDSHIGRMAADQHDAVLGAVNPRQCLLQFAMDRALPRYHAAGRYRGAVTIDCCLRRFRDPRVAVEADVIVGREIDVGAVADQRLSPGDPLMHAKEWIGDVEIFRRLLDQPDFPISLQFGDVEPARPAVMLSGVGPAPQRGTGSDGGHQGQFLQEARFRLRGQSEEIPAGCQWLYSAAAELISLGSSGAVAASSAEATRSSYAAS